MTLLERHLVHGGSSAPASDQLLLLLLRMYYHPSSCEASPNDQLCRCSPVASISVTGPKAPVIVCCSSHYNQFCRVNFGHCCQEVERVERHVQIVQAWWSNWELPAKFIWSCWFVGIRVACHNLWFKLC